MIVLVFDFLNSNPIGVIAITLQWISCPGMPKYEFTFSSSLLICCSFLLSTLSDSVESVAVSSQQSAHL